jgi:hypothetical protein
MDCVRLLLLAKLTRPALAFALASFSLLRVNCRAARRRLHLGLPEPGDEQEGAWPRERLEQMDARFVERVEPAIASGATDNFSCSN